VEPFAIVVAIVDMRRRCDGFSFVVIGNACLIAYISIANIVPDSMSHRKTCRTGASLSFQEDDSIHTVATIKVN
jgi:hypothetical protein